MVDSEEFQFSDEKLRIVRGPTAQSAWSKRVLVAIAVTVALAAVLKSFAFGSASESAQKVQVLRSETISISIPDGWRKVTNLHPDAELQATDTATDSHLAVFIDPKGDLTLEDLATLSERSVRTALEPGAKMLARDAVSVGGHPAIRMFMRGTKDGKDITHTATVVDAPAHAIGINAWTPSDRYDETGPVLLQIADSLRTR